MQGGLLPFECGACTIERRAFARKTPVERLERSVACNFYADATSRPANTRVTLQLDAKLRVPWYVPAHGIGDAVAEGFVTAACRGLADPVAAHEEDRPNHGRPYGQLEDDPRGPASAEFYPVLRPSAPWSAVMEAANRPRGGRAQAPRSATTETRG